MKFIRQRGKKENTNKTFSFPHCPPSLVPFALSLPVCSHFFRLTKTSWQPKFARWNTLPRALSRRSPTKQPETRPLEFKSLLSFILRVLLDRYAACRSSKDVVEVQHAWLQECEKEKVERLTQGICLLDSSVVFSLSFKMHARGEAPRRKSHHFSLCFQLHCTKMNNFCHSEICAESVIGALCRPCLCFCHLCPFPFPETRRLKWQNLESCGGSQHTTLILYFSL